MCESLFKDGTLPFNFFFVPACVFYEFIVHASVGRFCKLRKSSGDGRLKRDVLKLLGRTKCPVYFVVTPPAPSTHQ